MEVLIVETDRACLRAEIWGWSHEDTSLFVPGKPIGMTPGPKNFAKYDTVLGALADGWKMLGPPTQHNDAEHGKYATWWLTREK